MVTVTTELSTNLNWALQYARLGWNVFPVSNTKVPMTTNGLLDGTTDENQIRAWWKKHPSAGIGVATGAKSGIIVLDVDMDKAGAEDNLKRIVENRGLFPQNVVARSGGGGWHFYFKHPGENIKVPNAQQLFGMIGIDVRGDGGYIVVPPSGHISGNQYEWGDEQSPFDSHLEICPDYLYKERAAQSAAGGFHFSGIIAEGERNSTLTSVAGLLRSFGLDQDQILFILRQQNEMRCNPPLPDNEVVVIASHIVQYPPRVNRASQSDRVGLTELLAYERSDAGFGAMIAFALLGRVKFNHTNSRWFIWGKHSWTHDQVEEILLKAIDVSLMFRQAAELITDEDMRDSARKYAVHIQHRARLEAGLLIARAQPSIATTQQAWNQNPDILAVTNGVIDLKTGVLRDGSPDDLISAEVPVEYDPNAKAPLWDQFLKDVFRDDKKVIDFVQRAVGYSLTGRTTEQCLFLLVGRGANGKSTFLDTIHTILGKWGYPAPFQTFERTQGNQGQTNDLAALAEKRFVSASEPNEGVTFSESRIKSLTGGDTITARFLHQEFFEYKPTFKIWLCVNHLPRVVDDSDGFWRRVRRIDFPERFMSPEEVTSEGQKIKDPDLVRKLKAEYQGILAWAVQGAVKWYTDGLHTPETVVQSTAAYRQDSDPLAEFFAIHCEKDDSYEIPADDLYRAYTAHCHQRMMKTFEILSNTRFHQRMGRELPVGKMAGARSYLGIQLKNESTSLLDVDTQMVIKYGKKSQVPGMN